jgi:hypothetical protein
MVYNDSSSGPQTSSILSSLARSKDRVIKIINWKLQTPNFPDLFKIFQQNVHENGQMLAVNDCLYRFAGVVDWVGVVDLDEYVVGKCTSSLKAIFNSTDPTPYTVAFQFRSAFFNGTCKNDQVRNTLLTAPFTEANGSLKTYEAKCLSILLLCTLLEFITHICSLVNIHL